MDYNVNDTNYCSALCIFRKRNFKRHDTVDFIARNIFLKYNECTYDEYKISSGYDFNYNHSPV